MGGHHRWCNWVNTNVVLFEGQGTGGMKETSDTMFGGYVECDRGGTEVAWCAADKKNRSTERIHVQKGIVDMYYLSPSVPTHHQFKHSIMSQLPLPVSPQYFWCNIYKIFLRILRANRCVIEEKKNWLIVMLASCDVAEIECYWPCFHQSTHQLRHVVHWLRDIWSL